jgi:hypothetical protein
MSRRVLLAALTALLLSGSAAAAEPPTAPGIGVGVRAGLERLLYARCLTPDAGAALNRLVESGRLASVLPREWTLTRGAVGSEEIGIEVRDPAQHLHAVTLALVERGDAAPDGRGRNLIFYLSPSASAADAPARPILLALAAAFDAAIPDSAIQPCAGKDAPRGERRYPRRVALLGGLAEIAIVLAAIGYGLRALHTVPPP